jgi:hypothetical protein
MSDRPVFVVGFPRSGTTLLRLMLHSHPRIAIPHETSFLLEAYHNRKRFGDLSVEANRRALARFIVDRKESRFHLLKLDGADVTERIVAAPPTLGSCVAAVYRAYADQHGKPRWGDKRPSYVRWLDVVLRMYPDAQIINLVRDGRDPIASLLDMPWNKQGIYYWVAQWVAAVDAAARAEKRLPADAYTMLRYEDLVADPEPHLRRLCEFLGETYDPAMSQPDRLAATIVPTNRSWHDRTRTPVTTKRIGTWAQRLEPWQIELCETAMGDRLRGLGYELSGAGRPPVAHWLRYERAATRQRLSPAKRAAIRAVDRLRSEPPVAARPAAARPIAPRPALDDVSPTVGADGHTRPG